MKGKDRCTLHVHPDDAARLGLADGGRARVRSRAGAVEVPVEVTDAIMPGVVSIPHGWGHDARRACGWASRAAHAGRQQQRARRRVAGRPAVGQRRAERDPGRGRAARSEPIRREARMKGHGYSVPPRARGGPAAGPPHRRAPRRRSDLPRLAGHLRARLRPTPAQHARRAPASGFASSRCGRRRGGARGRRARRGERLRQADRRQRAAARRGTAARETAASE